MARYLVVAHRTAKSPELARKLAELRSRDPEARFVLLVPAVPPAGWVYEEGEIQRQAKEEAEAAKAALEAQGISIEEAKPGDVSPILALEEELMAHPGEYQAIVLATLPPGLSRWLRLDVHSQAERFGLPVIHVIAH
uniref:Universal stress protein n=1 Tax=Thermus tengchongensis TaxID=1214928 RepID=A0A7V4A1H1_9DEIN